MNFNPDAFPPKGPEKTMEEDDAEWLADYETRHPKESIALRDCKPESNTFLRLCDTFEKSYSLEKLHAIKEVSQKLKSLFWRYADMTAEQVEAEVLNLDPEEKDAYLIRTRARLDLIPIVELLGTLEKETNITKSALDALKVQYKALARAVGMLNINEKVIDHTR